MFGGMSYRPGLACSQQTCVWMHGNVDVAFTFKRDKKKWQNLLYSSFFIVYLHLLLLYAELRLICRLACLQGTKALTRAVMRRRLAVGVLHGSKQRNEKGEVEGQ